ncbi:hypothetical protein [uncultured Pseudokineococcus sp.]|uniref:hypothetical protein n=1 Tax=uncultured Pseudokineococcus sp. TaxID=1642928 RepID=UPI00262305E4|nr:hypothetical protein [uncultured Pseudokineococcus sp.]
MSTDAAPPTRPPRRLTQGLLLVVALTAAGLLAVMVWTGMWTQGAWSAGSLLFSVGLTAFNLAPFAAMAAVVVLVARVLQRGAPAAALGVVALAALTAVLLVSFVTSESSTAGLLFLFLPVYLGLVALVTLALAAVLHRVLQRRAQRREAPDDGPPHEAARA